MIVDDLVYMEIVIWWYLMALIIFPLRNFLPCTKPTRECEVSMLSHSTSKHLLRLFVGWFKWKKDTFSLTIYVFGSRGQRVAISRHVGRESEDHPSEVQCQMGPIGGWTYAINNGSGFDSNVFGIAPTLDCVWYKRFILRDHFDPLCGSFGHFCCPHFRSPYLFGWEWEFADSLDTLW